MTRLRAALRRRLDPASDSGVSLVELIVTMMVTGVVLAIVGSMFVNIAFATSTSNATNTRTAISGNIMNEMSKVIRLAANNAVSGSDDPEPAIVTGTATALTVYAYVDTSPTDPKPSKVTFRVDSSGTVFEDRIVGTLSGSYYVFTGATTTRSLGGPIVPAELFAYLDVSNKAVTPGSTGLTLAQRDQVASVKVTVVMDNTSRAGSSDPVRVVNTIGMPNLLLSGTDD